MSKEKDQLNKIKVLIVGSGIIGKSNAFKLSDYGFDITLVDQNEINNASNASLGFLMGKIYQKRKGRSWKLREKSLELWPKWLIHLQNYNSNLKMQKPLIYLTSNLEKFNKLIKLTNNYPEDGLEIIRKNSPTLMEVNDIFKGNKLQGLISHQDGRIEPKKLLATLNTVIETKNIQTIKGKVIQIEKENNKWKAKLQTDELIVSDVIILCNSLESLNLLTREIHSMKLKPVLGQAIELYCPDNTINFLRLPKHLNINGKNLIPLSQQKIIIGSTDEFNVKPDKNYIYELLNFLDRKPDWLSKSKIFKKWFGIRSRPEGEPSPLLKSLDKGLILCTGFYKNGILLAPACSNWISEEIYNHI